MARTFYPPVYSHLRNKHFYYNSHDEHRACAVVLFYRSSIFRPSRKPHTYNEKMLLLILLMSHYIANSTEHISPRLSRLDYLDPALSRPNKADYNIFAPYLT